MICKFFHITRQLLVPQSFCLTKLLFYKYLKCLTVKRSRHIEIQFLLLRGINKLFYTELARNVTRASGIGTNKLFKCIAEEGLRTATDISLILHHELLSFPGEDLPVLPILLQLPQHLVQPLDKQLDIINGCSYGSCCSEVSLAAGGSVSSPAFKVNTTWRMEMTQKGKMYKLPIILLSLPVTTLVPLTPLVNSILPTAVASAPCYLFW